MIERVGQFFRMLPEIGFEGICDIIVIALFIYAFLVAAKRTRRSGLILAGVVVVTVLYLLALKLNLVLTVTLLQGFFTVFLVALIVIFQEDLRYFFERVGLWWVERRLPLSKRRATRLSRSTVDVLARTLDDLARARVGALVVIRGHDVIARHLEGGEEVQGRMSEPLLKSIFDPHSIGHDGALTIEGDKIDKLGCHLPLSTNLEQLSGRGTRHAAALGLSELSDALCLVVSEERGEISVARRGEMRRIRDQAELAEVIRRFYDEVYPVSAVRPWHDFIRRNSREKAVAFGLSLALWLAVVHRSQVISRTFDVPVQYTLLGNQYTVKRIDPPTVRVTFSGQRREFTFLERRAIKLALNLWDARKGHRPYPINSTDLSRPGELELVDIEPRQVYLDIEEKPLEPVGGEATNREP